MLYIVGYRKFQIVRNDPRKPFYVFKRDVKDFDNVAPVAGPFWAFADARRECDYLS